MNKKISIISPYGSQLYFSEETIPYGGAEVRAREIIKSLVIDDSVTELKLFLHGDNGEIFKQTFKNNKLKIYKINFLPFYVLQKKFSGISNIIEMLKLTLKFLFRVVFGKFNLNIYGFFRKLRFLLGDLFFKSIGFLFTIISSAILFCNLMKLGFIISKNEEIIIFGVNSFNLFITRCLNLLHRKNIVLFLTSDDNVSDDTFNKKTHQKFDNYRSYVKHHFILLKKINRIVCQNSYQMDKINKYFKKKIINLKSPTEILSYKNLQINEKKYDFIWIGKIDVVKDFQYLIELAKKYHYLNFVIFISAINMPKERVSDDFINLKNVTFFKYANNEFVYEYIRQSKFLINTSKFEGFPNTFIESMKFKVPIISLNVNPNEIFYKYNVGFFANMSKSSLEKYLLSTRKIPKNLYMKTSEDCYNYILENHDQKKFNKQFLDFLEN